MLDPAGELVAMVGVDLVAGKVLAGAFDFKCFLGLKEPLVFLDKEVSCIGGGSWDSAVVEGSRSFFG